MCSVSSLVLRGVKKDKKIFQELSFMHPVNFQKEQSRRSDFQETKRQKGKVENWKSPSEYSWETNIVY